MTDFTDDELVSAVLDGEASDTEVARVHADPVLAARLIELRSARDSIAGPVVLPSSAPRDAAVAAAIGAAPAVTVTAIDLDERRRRRALRVASVAAALLIVIGIIGGIAALSTRRDQAAKSSAAGQASSSAAAPVAGENNAPSPDSNAGAAADSLPVTQLGSFSSPQALADAARQSQTHLPTAPQQPDQPKSAAASSDFALEQAACPDQPGAQLVALAQLAGQPVSVFVSGTPGQQTLEIVDPNCVVVFSQTL